MLDRRACLTSVLALAMGCSADSVPLSKPTLVTPGAFVAVPVFTELGTGGAPAGSAGAAGFGGESGSQRYQLIRIAMVLDGMAGELLVFHFRYAIFDSIAAARAATRERLPPPPTFALTSLTLLEDAGAVVVGYRSLTAEEQRVVQ